MKLRLSILIFFLTYFSFIELQAQSGLTPAKGAESLSLGGNVSSSTGIESILNNQAGLSDLNGFAVIVSSEQRFLLSELLVGSAGIAYNRKGFGTVGLVVSSFGFEEYSEQKIGLAYSRKLFDNLSMGGQLDYLTTRIDGFGSNSAITFELGVQSELSEQFMIGAHIFSPGTVKINDTSEIPSRINIGLKYSPTSKVYVVGEIEKLLDRGLSIQGGINYQIINELYLRVGTSTNPTRMSFGVAYGFNQSFRFDGALVNHDVLGLTPAASVKYQK